MTTLDIDLRPSVGVVSLYCPKAPVGGIELALVETVEGDIAISRRYGDAPEIDG